MPEKFKNFFSFFAKKKPFLLVFFFVILGIFYPNISLAFWAELANQIGTNVIFYISFVFVKIAIFIVKICGSLLNWVLSPSFISYSYTNPGGPNGNPIIKTGLEVTRGFVNMLLVLVLVYIAIATILRLKDYEAQKLLPIFIVVALLVNFSPIICGLIVDASNIVMNFFVQDLKADAFGKIMTVQVEGLFSGFTNPEMPWSKIWEYTTQIAVMVPFLFVLSFILLTFVLIFILRYIVIWLLVILSPLAFVCYILPATRKYFKQWWQQFLAWSFIGVTCGFFLYLGLLMVTKIQASSPVSTPTTEGGGLFNSILPYFVSVVFLGLGIVFGLKTSAIGAKVTMQGFIRGEKAVTKVSTKRGWEGIKKGGRVIKAEAGRIKRTYETGRDLGLSRTQATGETARAYWQTRMRPAGQAVKRAVTTKAGAYAGAKVVAKKTWSATKGVISAVRDTGEAFFRAALKAPKKKKGQVTCKQCNSVVSAGDFCSVCGEKLG